MIEKVSRMAWKAPLAALAFGVAAAMLSVPAHAGPECGDTAAGFSEWLRDFKQQAIDAGISPATISSALGNVDYDESVIAHDRNQGSFQGNVAKFAAKRVTPYRVKKGRNMLIAYAEAFDRIEAKFGVPAPVLVAIWGLESEFGAGSGSYPTFAALATLAYDCRRSDQFQQELLDALQLAQRGAIDPARARGAWAGEIGQTQFMPSVYLQYAVSLDGHGIPDLVGNPEDALASTANYLKKHGWRRGVGWHEGQANYDALLQWNEAPVYAKTIALFADKLAAP
jgi:lytic murein transglycosylase